MIFNQSYYTAMDRGYYMPLQPGQGMPGESPDEVPEMGVSPKDIGVSTHPAQDQLQQVKARIFQGASRVELGFFGRGKGSFQGGNTTPEMYGKEERIDIRELAKINKIQVTTHASTAAGSLAGFGQQGFDEFVREQSLHEIERAVDFAADVSKGGAIVVHANEFPRPIRDYWGDEKFEAYPAEEERGIRYLVDKRSGQVIPVRRNEIFYEPTYKDYSPGDPNYWLGVKGQKIPKNTRDTKLLFERVPEVKFDENGVPTFVPNQVTWREIERRAEELKKTDPAITPEKLFYEIQLQNQIAQSRGASLFYGLRYKEVEKQRDKYKEAYAFYKKLDESLPESEKWKLKQQTQQREYFVPPEVLNPVEYLKEQLEVQENQLRQMHQSSAAADAQAEQTRETIKNLFPIKEYALDKTADTVARSALYAWDKENHLRKEVVGNEKMERPLFVAVENLFPEQYGGHPDEVREIVLEARKDMVRKIMGNQEKYGISREEDAKKIAEDHIKATWDTGHAYIWKKYFKGSDEEFKQWYLEKAKDWKNKGIMGHVHVSDNFGWDDEHVIPGQGTAPIKEFISLIRDKVEKGEIDLIVEPAHQDYRALLGGWRVFGSSIYGASFGKRESWVDLERSYFGRTAPPYFLYGETAPDPEAWTFWSGTRLE